LPIQFKIGLENLPTCLRDFISTFQKVGIDVDNLFTISIFKKLHFPDGTIAHSDNSFYNKPEFSNVAVEMEEDQNEEYISDETYCYAQVINQLYVSLFFFISLY